MKHLQKRIHRGEDVGLRAPKRGKPEGRQSLLQGAKITTPEGEIMHQIASTLAVVGMNGIKACRRTSCIGDHLCTDGRELVEKTVEFFVVRLGNVGGLLTGRRHHISSRTEVEYLAL
jgi:hypothetical protein